MSILEYENCLGNFFLFGENRKLCCIFLSKPRLYHFKLMENNPFIKNLLLKPYAISFKNYFFKHSVYIADLSTHFFKQKKKKKTF